MIEQFDISSPEFTDKPTHECGVGLIYSAVPTIKTELMIQIGNSLQHRGQNGAGIASSSDGMLRRSVGTGLLSQALTEEKLEKFNTPNTWSLIHLRYGTQGGYNAANLQPIEVWSSEAERLAVAVNGNMPFARELRDRLAYEYPSDMSDTYIASQVLARMEGADWDEKIMNFVELPEIKHSANNMFIGVGDTMYVVRDGYGLHPLVMGSTAEGDVAIVSETVALQKIGGNIMGEFPAGGVLKLSREGINWLREEHIEQSSRCIFEPAYFMGPNSDFPPPDKKTDYGPESWKNVVDFRMKCGEIMIEEAPPSDIDFVIGMPDSGVPFAQGMANALGKDYMPIIIRSHYHDENDTRTFMQDFNKTNISTLVKGKLMPVEKNILWNGKNVLIGDDSLVRGNTALAVTNKLRNLGVNNIHWRYGFPMVQHPCEFGVSFRSQGELLAAQQNGDWDHIAAEIGASSVGFISNEGILRAAEMLRIPLEELRNSQDIFIANGWCGSCVTGKSPMHQRYQHDVSDRKQMDHALLSV